MPFRWPSTSARREAATWARPFRRMARWCTPVTTHWRHTQLTWFDRAGRALGTLGEAAPYINLALSPDERRVAVALGTGSPENLDIWIIDIARNVRSRLTVDPGADGSPVWSPDGTRIAFGGQRSGKVSLRQKLINGTAADESLLEGSGNTRRYRRRVAGPRMGVSSRIRSQGRFRGHPMSGSFRCSAIANRFRWHKPRSSNAGVFSPDGRWIAYTTNESGQPNVYVQPFLRAGGKYQVSRDGGSHPVWRADGKELFYLGADGTLMAVPIDATGQFDAGVPQALFPTGRARYSSTPARCTP